MTLGLLAALVTPTGPATTRAVAADQAARPTPQKPDLRALPLPEAKAPTAPTTDTWPPAEVAEAESSCRAALSGVPLVAEPIPAMRNGACGTPAPISVSRLGAAAVELSPPAVVNCRMAVALANWARDRLQPAAKDMLGAPVTRILTASSYVCRNRYGQSAAPISEHAFANALDISGFVLADGRTIKVLDAWGLAHANPGASPAPPPSPTAKPKKPGLLPIPSAVAAPAAGRPAELLFLQRLHREACGPFSTVLGPDANAAHRDHLHIDMKLRAAAALCQ